MDFINIIGSLISAVGIASIITILEYKRLNIKKFIILSFGLYLIWGSLDIHNIKVNHILMIVFVALLNYIDNGEFIKGAIRATIGLFIIYTTSGIVASLIDSNYFIINYTIFIVIFDLLIAGVLAFILRKYYKLLKAIKVKGIPWILISIILIVIVSMMAIYITTIPRATIDYGLGENAGVLYDQSAIGIYLIIIIGMLYFLAIKLQNEIKYKSKLKEANQLKEYTESLEAMSGELRKFRHDYVNILSSITGYVDDNDMEGLRKHLYSEIIPLEKHIIMNNSRLDLLKNIKVPEVKGLVSSKIIKAQELNINVTVDVLEEIPSLNGDIVSLCRILGILLDNAIEESIYMEESQIAFGVIKNPSTTDFIISNSCRDNIEPIYKLKEKGYSTKTKGQGLGLSIVEELVDKSNTLILDTIVEKGKFIQILTVED